MAEVGCALPTSIEVQQHSAAAPLDYLLGVSVGAVAGGEGPRGCDKDGVVGVLSNIEIGCLSPQHKQGTKKKKKNEWPTLHSSK